MSKLSGVLKALIDAPFAHSKTLPAPRNIQSIFERIGRQAELKKVEKPIWLAMTTAATMTMNSPESLQVLHGVASARGDMASSVKHAEFMREVGLKCIGLNGIPRTINCLGAFRASLPDELSSQLSTQASRTPTSTNIEAAKQRGRALWDSIYRPFETKLIEKLAQSHPDLSVHIVNTEYGLLFANPPQESGSRPTVGRIATSVMAIACLRSQSGVGPQVTSHLFGLRKALDDGTWKDDIQGEEGARWLASDDGGVWMLESIDSVVEAIGTGKGSSFAPARTKL